jgi:hypothetical protein
MERKLLLQNGIVVHEENIELYESTTTFNFNGDYDTVISDNDKIYNIGDSYNVDDYGNHYCKPIIYQTEDNRRDHESKRKNLGL